MRDKDEIRSLNTKINSLKYQIRQMTDYKEENIFIKDGLKKIKEDIENVNKENIVIQTNITPLLNTFKKLISLKQTSYTKIINSYNKDILSQMEKDKNLFENQISEILKKSDKLIDNLYQKVNQFISGNKSEGESNIDLNTLKYNLLNISREFIEIFDEVKKILELSSQHIAEESKENTKNIKTIEATINEVDRIMEYVPLNQRIKNNILGSLGINASNYPLNTATSKIILSSMHDDKKKRQTHLKSILNQVKEKSSQILERQEKLKNEILSAINYIKNPKKNNDSNNDNNPPIENLEELFDKAKKNGKNNIEKFEQDVCDNLANEIEKFKKKIEDNRKKNEDLLSQAKIEFLKQWAQIKTNCCSNILDHAKNKLNYFFLPKLENYQKYDDIIEVLKETIYAPEYKIINFGLLNCSDSIKKIKQDVLPTKCIIPIGNINEYKEKMDELINKELNYLYYNNDKKFSDFYNNVGSALKKITYINNLDIIFPVIIVHYNNYSEFEKDIFKIEKFIINCLKIKVAFIFFFGYIQTKEMKSINKKINSFIEEKNSIKETIKESKYELSPELGHNFDTIKYGVEVEMEKLINFRKDSRNRINNELKQELKTEYFNKIWDVYNSHSTATDFESIKNAENEELSRQRCVNSLIDFSILSLNLDKKPKEKQLKDKELEKMYQNITQIFKEIYDEKLLKDFNEFMDDILNKKKFELYINRERLMGEIDLKFNTCILIEEPDGNKILKQIGEEISILIDKNYKKDVLKMVGSLIWTNVFDKFRPKFYSLMKKGFEIPDNFEDYLIESFEKK